jgi:hypothetical protein
MILLEVSDASEGVPQVRRNASPLASGGRGLYIVEELSSEWGVRSDGGGRGKTVWVRLPVERVQGTPILEQSRSI